MKFLCLILFLLVFTGYNKKESTIQIDRNKTMMYGDASRLGRPIAKDPYVIRFTTNT